MASPGTKAGRLRLFAVVSVTRFALDARGTVATTTARTNKNENNASRRIRVETLRGGRADIWRSPKTLLVRYESILFGVGCRSVESLGDCQRLSFLLQAAVLTLPAKYTAERFGFTGEMYCEMLVRVKSGLIITCNGATGNAVQFLRYQRCRFR